MLTLCLSSEVVTAGSFFWLLSLVRSTRNQNSHVLVRILLFRLVFNKPSDVWLEREALRILR